MWIGWGLKCRRYKRLYRRYDWRYMQRHRRLGQLHAHMRGGAERAVRVGDVPLWMDVDSLNRPAGYNQRDAQQREEKPPRTLHLRSWAWIIHAASNISQDADVPLMYL